MRDQLDAIAVRFAQGVAAARPAAGMVGRLYYTTDTAALSYDTGDRWRPIDGEPERARVVGTAGQPGFWDSHFTAWRPVRFWRDGTRVHLAGTARGTNSLPGWPIFYLPVGYRPAQPVTCLAPRSDSNFSEVVGLDVGTDGLVCPSSSSAGYFALDSVSFDVAR